ncbi:MAG: hypothetical protein ACFFE4_22930 [Candidatus Thorarchaeota archaeon]
MIASKSSKSLRFGLNQFNKQFATSFASDIKENYHNVSRFDDATIIVCKVFDYIPKY